jgi:hypothetical protein
VEAADAVDLLEQALPLVEDVKERPAEVGRRVPDELERCVRLGRLAEGSALCPCFATGKGNLDEAAGDGLLCGCEPRVASSATKAYEKVGRARDQVVVELLAGADVAELARRRRILADNPVGQALYALA